jgi:glycosyltransferase involved in cell wall biosynthesis
MTPTVTIVMPCYNGAERLGSALASVSAQTYADFELVFVDDGSTDGSAALASSVPDGRVRVFRQANAGVSAARNRGLAEARGEFVAFLDADDTWHLSFLERMVEALRARPDAALAYCGWQNVGVQGPRGEPYVPPDYEYGDKTRALLASCPWPIHAALTRTAEVHRAGGFDSELSVGEDFLLWLEIAFDRPIVRVGEVLAYYHHHGGAQATRDRLRASIQSLRAQEIFLRRHPEVASRLGRDAVRSLTLGRLLEAGYREYWHGDLATARGIFRRVMLRGYGHLRDWKYMLPSLLPFSVHSRVVALARSSSTTEGHNGA